MRGICQFKMDKRKGGPEGIVKEGRSTTGINTAFFSANSARVLFFISILSPI
jgi:hypothetical protein